MPSSNLFTLSSAVAVLAATFASTGLYAQDCKVQLGPAQPIPYRLYTFNTNLLTATAFHGLAYDGPEFDDLVRDLQPNGLRFPGGTIANNYLWREDSFSEQKDDKTGWAGEQLRLFRRIGRPYGLPGFARICQKYKLEPIWVLNVYEESPDSAVALMEHLADLGLEVRMVEMGNEPYWDPRSLINVWKYIQYCRPIAAALKQHDPEIQIGACFGPLHQTSTNYEEKWNGVLAEQKWYDAIVYHEYYGGQGFAMERGTKLPVPALLHPEPFLDLPVSGLKQAAPGKPIWLTEWNIGSKGLEQWKDTGAELLFLAATFTRLLEHRDSIDMACFHQIYGGSFGTSSYDKGTGTMQRSASWHFFRLLGAALHQAKTIQSVTVETDDVRGFAVTGEEGARLFLLNRGVEARRVKLPDAVQPDAKVTTIDCPPEQRLNPGAPLWKQSRLEDAMVGLPGCSISLIGPDISLDANSSEPDAADNLFPRRPHLTLWYAPYARQQPRFDIHGVYSVDLDRLRDKPVVLVKMNLSAMNLSVGNKYRLAFEAMADQETGFVVKLPDVSADGEQAGQFVSVGNVYRRMQFTLAYSPETAQGEVTFVFPESTLKKGPKISFRRFRILAVR